MIFALMKKIAVVFFILLSTLSLGQNGVPFFLSLGAKRGFMIAHRPFMEHLIQENTWGYELSFSRQMNDGDYYSTRSNYPLNGFTFEIRNFGYDKVLGFAYSIFKYQNFTLIQTQTNWCLDFKVGTGLTFITKKYDKINNPKNNAIGSHLNAKVAFKLELNKFFKTTHFGIGTELTHFSNGAMQMPNLGLNGVSAYLNFGYNFNQRDFNSEKTKALKRQFDNSYSWILEGIISMSEVYPIPLDAKKYPIFAGRFLFTKPLNRSWNYEIAFDGVYNVSNLHKYFDSSYTAIDVPQLGIYAGLSFNYYRSQFVFGMGYYVLDIINPLGRIYNRVGYRYFFKHNWFGLFNIRANFGKADFFELGLGYKF
ncbi:MAG TPA: hypothetical protein EYG85_00710 [Crocinitomix sp.]|nr:hypothetical protein [Crocinitomix sp.]